MDRCKENVIEWIEDDKIAKCTFSQKRFVNRIKKMAEKHGTAVTILAENEDGSIYASVPVSAVRITILGPNKGSFKGVQDEADS